MRTPAIVRWPGKVKAGAVTDEILSAVDNNRLRKAWWAARDSYSGPAD